MNRKNFIKTSTGLLAVSALPASSLANVAANAETKRSDDMNDKQVMLKKSLTFGMIQEDLPLADKFKLVKDLGFDGVELNSPNDFDSAEVLEAKEKSGIELPSLINKDHWKKPLSDPDPAVRAACIESVATSLQDMKDYGGDTVLVVPGVVNDKVSYEQAYVQSQASIRELLPHAEKTGMQIALENVWNNFILSPLEAKRFLDEINHPLVGWYFDIGNIRYYLL